MYYPVGRTEQFPVHYFVGGFDGIVPASGYSTVLKAVASHGYIVAGSWALRGAEGANFTHQAHMENVKWVRTQHSVVVVVVDIDIVVKCVTASYLPQ